MASLSPSNHVDLSRRPQSFQERLRHHNSSLAEEAVLTLAIIIVLVSNMAIAPVAAVLASIREAVFTIREPDAPVVVCGDITST
jgi:hypothetical protein